VAAAPPPGFGIETISGLTLYGVIINLFWFFGNISAAIPMSIDYDRWWNVGREDQANAKTITTKYTKYAKTYR
jgi:hypothetical protein